MELMEAMKGRRSVRNFQDRMVPETQVRDILKVMDFSPNAGNRNSIRTVVLTNRDGIEYIGKAHTTIIRNFNRGIVSLPTEEAIEKSPSAFHNAPMVVALSDRKFHTFLRPMPIFLPRTWHWPPMSREYPPVLSVKS